MSERLKNYIVKNNSWLIPVSLGLFAFLLLIFRLGERSLWMDETAVLNFFKFNPLEFLGYYFQEPDNHAPLYYFLVICFYKIFGGGAEVVRMVSVLSGVGIVVTVYYFALLLFKDKKIASLGAVLLATGPFFILISQMARYHSLSALLTLNAFYWFYRWIEEGRGKWLFLLFTVLTGWTDYPHFIYLVGIVNIYFLYLGLRHSPRPAWIEWIKYNLLALASFLPMVWLIFHRIVFQGDRGFGNTNLLHNGIKNIVAGMAMHVYVFLFGENTFPWDWAVFGLGLILALGLFAAGLLYWKKGIMEAGTKRMFMLFLGLILANCLFFNVVDPRYNFTVYPKFGFVSYPVWILALAGVMKLLPAKWRYLALVGFLAVNVYGLANFYQAKNYLNASYFSDYSRYEHVRDNSRPGDYLLTSADAYIGVYDFYKAKYFSNLAPIQTDDPALFATLLPDARVWFFATASDEAGNVTSDSRVPQGFEIIDRHDSTPLDPVLKKYKEKILGHPSYNYKYTVFLLRTKWNYFNSSVAGY